MIDRIVHHADVLILDGASYRLRNRGINTLPSIRETADLPTSQADNRFTSRTSETTRMRTSSTVGVRSNMEGK